MAAITIGNNSQNRANSANLGSLTLLLFYNPADGNGKITQVEVYMAAIQPSDVYVGIFELLSGTTFRCRSAVNMGALSIGNNVGSGLNLAVKAGDYIAIYGQSGAAIDTQADGGRKVYYKGGNHCVVGDTGSFSDLGTSVPIYSLEGNGETISPVGGGPAAAALVAEGKI